MKSRKLSLALALVSPFLMLPSNSFAESGSPSAKERLKRVMEEAKDFVGEEALESEEADASWIPETPWRLDAEASTIILSDHEPRGGAPQHDALTESL
ncbi:MAG: hypothetical protein ACTSVF_04830, partial [Candidatus Asgardarchaeia archaeon]